jgi:S-DNA-T family DNA segregation ATPase FtsK/SpoIIIE
MQAVARRTLPGVENMVIRQRAAASAEGEESPPELDWVVRLQAMMPSFSDELTAFLLVAVGLLSFLTLLSPASGALGNAWSSTLRLVFGIGAYVVSGAILAAGVLLLIPKLGIHLKINWWRVLGGELLFIFLLAYLHTLTRTGITPDLAREDALASALEGAVGGLVGWALQEGLYTIFGDLAAEVIMLILIILSAGMMLGVTRQHILDALGNWRGSLMRYAWKLEDRPKNIIHPVVMQPAHASASAYVTDNSDSVESLSHSMTPAAVASPQPAASVPSPAPRRSPSIPVRISAFRDASGATVTPRSQREVKYSFTLKDHQDKKKVKKRGGDLPAMELLDALAYAKQDAEEINMNAQIIDDTIEDFGMRVKVIGVKAGPTVTQYAVQPYAEVEQDGKTVTTGRVRVTRLTALGQDLSLSLAASRVRIQAPVPGTNYIGVEVPNTRPGIVSLRPVMESERFHKVSNGGKLPLTIALGREVDGQPFAVDLATMPHLLIGGTTGSGKSVCLSAITTCLVANNKPDELRLIMIDPKMVELVRFNGLPHLLGRVEVEIDRILGVLRWLVREMDRRYKLMEEARARNISVYNQQKKKKDRFPYIVAMIDELAELMSEHPDDTEHLLTRLAQMARATGIHLVVATQRPSVDVLTGLIKANFPSRIAFAVASGVDSRVIIDTVGAEDLIGRGDMLYLASDSAAGPVRLQGCFVSDAEMERVVEFWRANWSTEEESAPWERALSRAAVLEETDQMLEEAIRIIQREGEASTSLLQRKLNISYPRAGRIMDSLYKIGAVGEAQVGGRSRVNLIIKDADPTNFIIEWHKRNG